MDFTESPEHRALRKVVAGIAGEFGNTYYRRQAADGKSQEELWRALGEHGFIGINVPEAYGGGDGGMVELAIVCEEVAAQGCPLILLLVSSAISAGVITRYGTEAQRRQWLPRLAAGTGKVVFAITEPDAGSNTHRLTTTAVRDGDGYVLSGTKYYISGVDEADAVLVVAKTGVDEKTGHAQLSLFIVDTDAPGLVRTVIPVSAGMPEKQFTLHFDQVRVGADRLLGTEGDGFRQVFHGLNPERITGGATAVGISRFALAKAAEYATVRTVWDQPIGAHQGIAHPLAKARIEVELAALMTMKAASLHDAGESAGAASNMAKYAAAEAAAASVDAAIQTHGGNGVSDEVGLMGLRGVVQLMRIAPVSREMILNYVAQHSLGLPRSY